MRVIGDDAWKPVGAMHYSCIVQRVIVGYYRRFVNTQWRVYKIVNGDHTVVGDYDDEARARDVAKLTANALAGGFDGK